MKIRKDETVCKICREIIKKKNAKNFLAGYRTFQDLPIAIPNFEDCCKKCTEKMELNKLGIYSIYNKRITEPTKGNK